MYIAGVFSVRLISSDASKRCGLKEQSYTLVITSVALQLRESDENDTLLFTWPYRFIRKYGYKAGRFTFEAGRKCISGEGEFHLEHSNQQEIFRCISSKMKNMKKLLNGEGGTSSIVCGDIQFQAALSMTARSRSPLPPSPTNITPLILDNNLNSFSCLAKPLMPLPSFGVPSTNITHLPPPLKPKPKTFFSMKLPTPFMNVHDDTKESPDDAYEDVLVRSDAWRTMGLNDSNHCEQSYCSNTIVSDSADNYDHLKHFGFIPDTAPGYKKIHPIASTIKHNKPYVKANTIMLPARKADDSHYGYGTINKRTSVQENHSNKEPEKPVAHNELQYALVFKPNKV